MSAIKEDDVDRQMAALVEKFGEEICLQSLERCHKNKDLDRIKKSAEPSLVSEEPDSLTESILEASFDGILLVNQSGEILRTNTVAVAMFGYDEKSSLLGKNISIVIGGSHGPKHAEYLKKATSQETIEGVLDRMRDVLGKRANGEEFPVKIGIRLLVEKEGNAPMFIAFCHDLSETKKDQALLQDHVQLSEAILNASFDAAFVTNDKGTIQRVNSTGLSMFGYQNDQNELLGKNISIIIGNAKHAAQHDKYMEGATQEKLDAIMDKMRDVLGKRKDGSTFPVQVGIKSVYVGKNCHFVAYVHDLSRHKSQLLVAESLLEGSFDATFLTDESGVVQRVNHTALTMFGYEEKEQLLGQNIACVIGGPHGAMHTEYFSGATQERVDAVLDKMRDVLGKRKDGSEFPVHVGIKILEIGGKRNFIAYCHNLTRHKTQMKKLEEQMTAMDNEKRLTDSILDSSFDSVFLISSTGLIEKVNASAVKEFQYDSEEFIGQNISLIVGGGHAVEHDFYVKRFVEEKRTERTIEMSDGLTAVRKDGSKFPCQVGIRSFPGTDKIVGFVRNMTAENEKAALAMEKKAAETLLLNMLPKEVALRLQNDPTHIADHFEQATTLFADIVGFTALSNTLKPIEVVSFLNKLFSRFDSNLDMYKLNKVKTIGDCYMVTSIPGCKNPANSCAAVCHFALDMAEELQQYNKENPGTELNIRIGINTGPVVAGVVGTKRFLYDIWGDSVNIASRMESTGVPGKIQVTGEVLKMISDEEFISSYRGTVKVKGIGEMKTFFLDGRKTNRHKSFWKGARNTVVKDLPRQYSVSQLLESLSSMNDIGDPKGSNSAIDSGEKNLESKSPILRATGSMIREASIETLGSNEDIHSD